MTYPQSQQLLFALAVMPTMLVDEYCWTLDSIMRHVKLLARTPAAIDYLRELDVAAGYVIREPKE